MSKCCICGSTDNLHKLKCTVNKEIYSYCINCLRQGIEKYDDLVAFGWKHYMYHEQFRKKVVFPTLRYYNKTVEEFNADVERHQEVNTNGIEKSSN